MKREQWMLQHWYNCYGKKKSLYRKSSAIRRTVMMKMHYSGQIWSLSMNANASIPKHEK
jgi:hypothetical protein